MPRSGYRVPVGPEISLPAVRKLGANVAGAGVIDPISLDEDAWVI